MRHHATAVSETFANHLKAGLTTPGLRNVPMPGCGAGGSAAADVEFGFETNLIINDLFERTTLVQQGT